MAIGYGQPAPKGEPRKRTQARKRRKERVVKATCAWCQGEYLRASWRSSKYCRPACYWESQRQRTAVQCENCGASVMRRAWQLRARRRHFCSPECSHAWHVGSNSAGWRGGRQKSRGSNWCQRAARIRARDEYRCRWCGIQQSEQEWTLSVDHVRPWRECASEEEANADSNLVSLCRRCHGKKLRLEHRWLRGDGLALQEYRRLVGIHYSEGAVDNCLPTAAKIGPPRKTPDYAARAIAISAAKKAFYAHPDNRKRASEISKKSMTADVKARLVAAARIQWADDAMRERMIDGMRKAAARRVEGGLCE